MRNPIVIVDELDKFPDPFQAADARNAIAVLIESRSARAFFDEYLGTEADLSRISWIFTANSTDPLKGPLLDRLEVLHVERPTSAHFAAIIAHIRREIARDAGVSEASLPVLNQSVMRAIREGLQNGVSLRRVKTAIAKTLQIAVELPPAIS